MKNNFSNILIGGIIGLSIIISVLILANTYKNRGRSNDIIHVTGLGKQDFTSDLIVWRGGFARQSMNLKHAYELLSKDQNEIESYLIENGVPKNEIVFSAVQIDKKYDYSYDKYGASRQLFKGYELTQFITIESKEVDKIEHVSRKVTELIDQGVEFYSKPPEYYYTGLAELKVEMIAAATEDARIRAEQIAENAGAKIGALRFAKMGIFQIIAQNSSEDYSWGGTFNTSSKMKTATITMKLQFGIE